MKRTLHIFSESFKEMFPHYRLMLVDDCMNIVTTTIRFQGVNYQHSNVKQLVKHDFHFLQILKKTSHKFGSEYFHVFSIQIIYLFDFKPKQKI